jgi:CheY-like chemotaxis protein
LSKTLLRLVGEHIEVETKLHPELGTVKVDRTQIEQVLVNLAVNARDAMPDGGELMVQTGHADFEVTEGRGAASIPAGHYVFLAVTDNGMGMSKEIQERIFEPFFTTKGAGKGTGLGLATVYGIVKQSGGFIWVYSEVGHGTTFKIYLPRVDETPLPVVQETAAGERGGSETILVVEDDEALRNLTAELLRDAGYHVLVSESATHAIELAEKHDGQIHLMLTDVIMPGMSGRVVAEKVAALRPGARVLYASGYTDDTVLRSGILSKEAHFIQKPWSRASLLSKVRHALEV